MRETCSSGSVRGAPSNERPYRERIGAADLPGPATTPSRVSTHDSGTSVVRYTLTARDFHSLLFAGFAGALIMSFPLAIDTQLVIEVLSS